MRVFLLRSVGAVGVSGLLLAMLSCAHDQQLVGIEIQPSTQTFGASNIPVPADAGLSIQLRALGHYIHPPVTKDITSQVTWTTDDVQQQMVTVSSAGVLTAVGGACGNSTVYATVNTNSSAGGRASSGAIVTGSMTANVVCFTGANGNDALLTVDIVPTGGGTVSITPPNQPPVNCIQSCTFSFPIGTGPITVTATPAAGFSFTGWSGCPSGTGSSPQCTINALNVDTTITANF